MKTERRHELETNQLADSLAHWGQQVKPYTQLIVGILIAIVVVIFATVYMIQQSKARSAAAWNEYLSLLDQFDTGSVDPKRLNDLADQFKGEPVGLWSRLLLADLQLAQGAQVLFTDKQDGRSQLKQAAENYQTVLNDSREPLIREQALFGLARAHEGLGMLDPARQEYQQLADQFSQGAFATVAKIRARDLAENNTKQFYDWFAKYEPPAKMSSEPGIPGRKPPFTEPVIDESQFKLRQGFGSDQSRTTGQQSPASNEAQPGATGDDSIPPATDNTEPNDTASQGTAAKPPAAKN